jgi:hypothetical protein
MKGYRRAAAAATLVRRDWAMKSLATPLANRTSITSTAALSSSSRRAVGREIVADEEATATFNTALLPNRPVDDVPGWDVILDEEGLIRASTVGGRPRSI